ncbi:EAL domain-containing response regulator [Dolichospermum sp. ST_sed1]|nr:EAL domain-containing response regulator [Dolichospermum sp. ST_sed1]MDD1427311.1 EAL domain-containing response regulator [Dolichospermum sp. ST_sed9]MDD1430864.1 EAL domain-containing response regulator [Dolichospermum sp. ST_sed6]MDD1438057.1 EAL domain-containing response regulator [Dolichospermum sp. ST_sed10]MDD1442453.1 EAL domain-containing response regulator [Dolichospermum sp. ST_sed3]MDD1446068.1 EAL domain-containing response regulator [Dolichospermum sp. ST_sed8]MDD1454278.1 E
MSKILVIEDEESVRDNLLDLLEAESFETVAAANGKIGVEMAMSEYPDLILCDIMMPELDGYGVLAALRQEPSTSTIPFIFLTANAAKSDFRQGMNMGADDYLTKPFTRAELLIAILNKLEKYANLKKNLSAISNKLTPRMQLVLHQLKLAIKNKNFEDFDIYYQPSIDINTGKITSAESLLRWQNAELGRVSPLEFIPLAESHGLIIDIGNWVLKTVCQQMQIWQDIGIHNLTIAVNLSPIEFNQIDLIPKVIDLISSHNLQSNCLELELTERMIMEDMNLAIITMEKLRSFGVKIALDDFGVSNNSLMYLKQLPMDTLKIDRDFIQDINSDYRKAAITKSLIQLGHDLDLKIIAEGVETEAELALLRENSCDAIQGYIYSPALPALEFHKLLLTNKSFSV